MLKRRCNILSWNLNQKGVNELASDYFGSYDYDISAVLDNAYYTINETE